MFRKRIYVKTGCLRCKKRRKKCDETRPKCGYCARWNLDCVRSQSKSQSQSRNHAANIAAEDRRSAELMLLARSDLSKVRTETASLTIADQLPVANQKQRWAVASYLHLFFKSMVHRALPFDIGSVQMELARGWFRSATTDVAVSYAFAAYSARLQAQTAITPHHHIHSLEFDGCSIAALRARANIGGHPTEETILLATLHLMTLAFDKRENEELRRISKGISIMVDAYGGYTRMTAVIQVSTMVSIQIADAFCTLLYGTPPMYRLEAAEVPSSPGLESLCTTSFDHPALGARCQSDVLDLMHDMHLILFFRRPSQQVRPLSVDEASHLSWRLGFFDNRVAILQVKYQGSKLIDEVILSTMMVLKQEVVITSAQHSTVVTNMLQRHRAVLLTGIATKHRDDDIFQDVLIWACLCSLVGSGLNNIRDEFEHLFTRLIRSRYGDKAKPDHWQQHLNCRLRSILWHTRLEDRYNQFCSSYGTNRGEVCQEE